MKNKNDYKEERFDSFINKTIMMSSITYFKKQMNISDKERSIIDDEGEYSFLQGCLDHKDSFNNIDTTLELNNAINSLSAIEQAVIFLLFHEELTQEEAAKILEIYSKTVSKIKIRAIKKLKKALEGENENEK